MLRAAFTSALHRRAEQDSHSKTAWLLRFPGATYPHTAHRCDVYAAGICSTRPYALCCNRAASRSQPLRLIARFSPHFCATFTPGCTDGPACTAGHRPHVEGFDPDRLEAARNCEWSFSQPSPCAGQPHALLVSRSPCLLRSRRLEPRLAGASRCCNTLKRFASTVGQTGCVQQFAGRQRRRHGNTAVDAHYTAVAGPADRIGDVGERDMPAAGPITDDTVGLHTLGHWSRQPKPKPTHLGHPYPTEAAVKPHDVTGHQRNLPKPLVHTGLTPRRAAMCAGRKNSGMACAKSRSACCCTVWLPARSQCTLGADLGQLSRLRDVARSLAARLPMLLLLHRQIPHKPRVAAMRQQHLFLLTVGQQPKSRHSRTLSTTTDIPGLACQPDTANGLRHCTKARGHQSEEVR